MKSPSDFHHIPVTGSTNEDLLDEFRSGGNPVALLTDHQTGGRGRLGRRWHNDAPSGTGSPDVQAMLGSIPQVWAPRERGVELVPFAAGMAVLDVVAAQLCPHVAPSVGLGWPNDVIVARDREWKKLAGILVETAPLTSPQPALGVVIGVGLNLTPVGDGADPEVLRRAISMAELAGEEDRSESNVDLFALLLDRLAVWTDRLRTDPIGFMRDYRQQCLTLSHEVTVHLAEGPFVGRAQEVTNGGELIIQRDGARRVVAAGDVVMRPV